MEIKTGLACNSENYKAGRTSDIKYIVVHYTGNSGDTALNNINYFAKNVTGSSAHYFVDENDIYQCVPDADTAWHCGTSGKYYHSECRNANSIGVEMCNFTSLNQAVQAKAVELVKSIMSKYNIDTAHILRHYDVTHKNCPAPFVEDSGAWENFKNLLEGEIDMEELNALEKRVSALENKTVYNYIDDNLPAWAKPTVQKLVEKGILQGTGSGLGLTDDLLRILVINDRAGLYGE